MIYGIIKKACPNCGGDIAVERLLKGMLCEKCMPSKTEICKINNIRGLKEFCHLKAEEKQFSNFFKKILGTNPYSLQKSWAKRALLGRSFGIIAPTGSGKSTFMLIYTLFAEGKSIIILPTTLLVEQTTRKLMEFSKATGKEIKILEFRKLTKKKREKFLSEAEKGEYDVAIMTSAFFYRHWEKFKSATRIIIDDVDSLLKSSKNIDKVLILAGIKEEELKKAWELIKKRPPDYEGLAEIKEKIQRRKLAQLIISSATIKPKTTRVRLLAELFGFQVGKMGTTLRNICDVAWQTDLDKGLEQLIKKFKDGIFVFVSQMYKKEKVVEITNRLNNMGIKAVSYEELDEEKLDKFKEGEIKVLVGISSYRNPLARGVDIPEKAKYAIFYGVPKIEFYIQEVESARAMLMLAIAIYNTIKDRNLLPIISKLRRLQFIKNPDLSYFRDKILSYLTPDNISKINKAENVAITVEGGKLKVTLGDVAGYLQASGRVSRLYAGGLTRGLAVILVDDPKALKNLEKRMSWFTEEPFHEFSEELLTKEMEKIEKEREQVKEIKKKGAKVDIKTALIVVESPTKVKTIARMFTDTPLRRRVNDLNIYEFSTGDKVYLITATMGHILDLVTKEGFDGIIFDNHVRPIYGTIKKCSSGEQFVDELECENVMDKKTIIEALREIAAEVDELYIGTDPDTEGEKIGFDIYAVLHPYGIKTKRMEFHAVTRKEIQKALKNLRKIDENLVKAQILRRVYDRLVGFELSKLAAKEFETRNISIGRVQTPVLGWLIQRDKLHKEKTYWVTIQGADLKLGFTEDDKKIRKLKGEQEIELKVLSKEEKEIYPPTPYSTDLLLQDANRILRFSAEKTMKIAQDLFEFGLITYHRTDSIRVSNEGLRIARHYLEEKGYKFIPRQYSSSEGAHECIRPTKPSEPEEILSASYSGLLPFKLTKDHIRLYSLIFRRFMASQMEAAIVRKGKLKVKIKDYTKTLEEYIGIIKEGFMVLYPAVHIINITKKFHGTVNVKRISKYPMPTQGEIIAMMKERGLGRPSTYSTIIQTLLKRGYVIERGGRLYVTKKGKLVYEFAKQFSKLVSEDVTRQLEEKMKLVEEGKENYETLLRKLYNEVKNLGQEKIY